MIDFDVASISDWNLMYFSWAVVGLILLLFVILLKQKNLKVRIALIIAIAVLVIFQGPYVDLLKRTYFLPHQQKEWKAKDLPQIDESMHLVYADRMGYYYISNSKDSVLHQRKSVSNNLFGKKKVSDLFENKKTQQYAISVFEEKRLFQKEKFSYTLVDKVSGKSEELKRYQFDSIITDWGLFEKAYSKFSAGDPFGDVDLNKK